MALCVSYVGFVADIPLLHLAWLSPAFTTLLLLKVSGVPMVEKAGEKKWGSDPAYRNYMDNTNLLIPGKPAPPLAHANGDKPKELM